MTTIGSLLAALDEREIARRVALAHDEVRAKYPLRSNTVGSYGEFSEVIGDYYERHFTTCVSPGGSLSRAEATSRAKELIEQEYRRRNGDISSAYNDAHDGTNGGMRVVLDTIAEGLKAESVRHYTRELFDRYVTPVDWDAKVEIIRQFIAECGVHLASSIQADKPERYAHGYDELIRSYVEALQRTSSVFRRL